MKAQQELLLRAELRVEIVVELLGAAHLERLGNHHRPRHDGEQGQKDDDDLGFGSGPFKDVNQLGLTSRTGRQCKENGCVHSNTIKRRRSTGREEPKRPGGT